ncbi:hypothetical protein [Flavobacterium sp.]|uniref:hypothetical protein n=1 Tax=Flavobacterium sp. TaxID=239 RepID=UPI002604A2EA|nr:hypothetical protein [Flavobacterium sp.]
MPLTAGLRDEENERINNILKRLIGLDYVPENGNATMDEILSGLGLNMQTLLDENPGEIILHLQKLHFDWTNAEQFADFLTTLSKKLPEAKLRLQEKAIEIYNYIQMESKTFSFEIYNKIEATKKAN